MTSVSNLEFEWLRKHANWLIDHHANVIVVPTEARHYIGSRASGRAPSWAISLSSRLLEMRNHVSFRGHQRKLGSRILAAFFVFRSRAEKKIDRAWSKISAQAQSK